MKNIFPRNPRASEDGCEDDWFYQFDFLERVAKEMMENPLSNEASLETIEWALYAAETVLNDK